MNLSDAAYRNKHWTWRVDPMPDGRVRVRCNEVPGHEWFGRDEHAARNAASIGVDQVNGARQIDQRPAWQLGSEWVKDALPLGSLPKPAWLNDPSWIGSNEPPTPGGASGGGDL